MVQKIIVILIVVGAVAFAIRALVRSIKGKSSCGCDCCNCPKSKSSRCSSDSRKSSDSRG